jgi:hypothetical protein
VGMEEKVAQRQAAYQALTWISSHFFANVAATLAAIVPQVGLLALLLTSTARIGPV